MNKNTYIFNKILAKQIQQYMKSFIYTMAQLVKNLPAMRET